MLVAIDFVPRVQASSAGLRKFETSPDGDATPVHSGKADATRGGPRGDVSSGV